MQPCDDDSECLGAVDLLCMDRYCQLVILFLEKEIAFLFILF